MIDKDINKSASVSQQLKRIREQNVLLPEHYIKTDHSIHCLAYGLGLGAAHGGLQCLPVWQQGLKEGK